MRLQVPIARSKQGIIPMAALKAREMGGARIMALAGTSPCKGKWSLILTIFLLQKRIEFTRLGKEWH